MRPVMITLLAVVLAVMLGAACCLAGDTPISKGGKMIGGSIVFSSMGGDLYEVGDKRVSYLAANPYLGVFVSDGFSVGGTLMLERYSSDYSTQTTFGIGPRLAYFIGAAGTRPEVRGSTYPVVGLAVFYIRGSESNDWDVTISGVSFAFGIGAVHMLTRDIGISLELTYQIDDLTAEWDYDWDSGEDSESGDQINFAIGLANFIYR